MKKIVILGAAFALLTGASANADVSVGFNFGVPVEPVYPEPAYVEPGPGYVIAPDYPSYHYDHHRHWHNDYWAHRQHDEHAGHEEHHAANAGRHR